MLSFEDFRWKSLVSFWVRTHFPLVFRNCAEFLSFLLRCTPLCISSYLSLSLAVSCLCLFFTLCVPRYLACYRQEGYSLVVVAELMVSFTLIDVDDCSVPKFLRQMLLVPHGLEQTCQLLANVFPSLLPRCSNQIKILAPAMKSTVSLSPCEFVTFRLFFLRSIWV